MLSSLMKVRGRMWDIEFYRTLLKHSLGSIKVIRAPVDTLIVLNEVRWLHKVIDDRSKNSAKQTRLPLKIINFN